MPLIYGEGRQNAFLRIQEHILKVSEDYSIFSWTAPLKNGYIPLRFKECSTLAESPQMFNSRPIPDWDEKRVLKLFPSDYQPDILHPVEYSTIKSVQHESLSSFREEVKHRTVYPKLMQGAAHPSQLTSRGVRTHLFVKEIWCKEGHLVRGALLAWIYQIAKGKLVCIFIHKDRSSPAYHRLYSGFLVLVDIELLISFQEKEIYLRATEPPGRSLIEGGPKISYKRSKDLIVQLPVPRNGIKITLAGEESRRAKLGDMNILLPFNILSFECLHGQYKETFVVLVGDSVGSGIWNWCHILDERPQDLDLLERQDSYIGSKEERSERSLYHTPLGVRIAAKVQRKFSSDGLVGHCLILDIVDLTGDTSWAALHIEGKLMIERSGQEHKEYSFRHLIGPVNPDELLSD
jgi:hypothetical protein